MSDAIESFSPADASGSAAEDSLPIDLPPVEPPSAGFIIQLFLVPGLIVLAVVGVWALFGKLAAGQQDWTSLVAELSHSNEHRRWRGAHGLAQMLQAEGQGETSEAKLTQNPIIVGELTQLFAKELAKSAPSDNDLQFQAFLARSMGLLEQSEKVIPVLREAMQPTHDREVRKNSLAAVAVIASRARKRGQPIGDAALVTDLIGVSSDTDPLMRQVAAFTLGLIVSERGSERLVVLLDDTDENTRLNAAISLARDGSVAGLPVFESVLNRSTEPFSTEDFGDSDPVKRQQELNSSRYQRDVRLLNTLQALGNIGGELSPTEVEKVDALLEKVSGSKQVAKRFRQRATNVRKRLSKAG